MKLQVTREELMTLMERQNNYSEESLNFLRRILEQSGTSDHTHWPPGTVKCLEEGIKRDISMETARYVIQSMQYCNCVVVKIMYTTRATLWLQMCVLIYPFMLHV